MSSTNLGRRAACLALVAVALAACGGGDGEPAPPMEGSIETRTVVSRSNGKTYPLRVYLPPASAGSRAGLPIVYALDGESRFAALVDIMESRHARVIVVAIGNEAQRAVDYVPANACTAGGGGHVAFLDFIRTELIPFVEASVGGDPGRRALLGHSHGGSFVFYALFADAAGSHPFAAYLPSDASLGCMPAAVAGWKDGYAAANASLPVRLHVSYGANMDNVAFAQQIRDLGFTGLTMQSQLYGGGHVGMIPAAFADAVAFAFAP